MSLINEISLMEMPYEKCKKAGPAFLTDSELLAVFIRTGSKDHSCMSIARELLGKNEDGRALLRLLNLTIPELKKMRGIGEVRAVQLVCMMELSKRIWRMKLEHSLIFTNPDDIAAYFMEEMRHLRHEVSKVLYLNQKNALIKVSELSVGTVNGSLLSPREIYIDALKNDAVRLVLLHNHPSGDPTPSRNDIEITLRVHRAGEMLGVSLLDHIIIGDNRYVSLKEAGYLPNAGGK